MSAHDDAVPTALAHTQSTAALATAPLVSVDLPAATATCALDSVLHFVPPRLVTVGAVASDVTLCILLALRLILLLARHHHTLPLVMLCATPFATTATGLTATGPTARLLLPATSPTTPASSVSSPCLPVRTPAPRHESTVSVTESGSVCVSVFLPRKRGEPLPDFSGALPNTSMTTAHSGAPAIF